MTIQRVLCPVDLSECSRRALEYAVAVSRCYQAHLTVLHVHMSVSPYDLSPVVEAAAASPQGLDALKLTLHEFVAGSAADLPLTVKLVHGPDPRRAIVEEIEAAGTDLLVVGSHGRGGFERFVLGSTTDRIIRKSPCPVLIVPPGAAPAHDGRFRRALCGIDFSAASLRAFRYALRLAAPQGEVTLLHAIEIPPELHDRQIAAAFDVEAVRAAAEAAARQRLAALSPGDDAPSCRITVEVREGRAVRELLAHARQLDADLIALGTHGRNAVERWLFGSTTSGILRDAPCPVLAIRPE